MPEHAGLTAHTAHGSTGSVPTAVGPLTVLVAPTSPDLQLSDLKTFPSVPSAPTRATLTLALDEARPPWPQPTDDDVKSRHLWDVWGPTPAWDAVVHCTDTHVHAHFSLDAAFVARFSRSRTAALQVLGRAALRLSLAVAAPLAEALLMHGAAAIGPDGLARLFVGPSGAGKTTIAGRLPGWTVLSDDTAIVWRDTFGWRVAGTPLRGREGHPTQAVAAPLAAIVALVPHVSPPRLMPLPPAEALHTVMARVFHHPSAALPTTLRAQVFALATSLATTVPVLSLENNLDAAIEPLLRDAGGPHV